MSFFRFVQRFRSLGHVSFGKHNTHRSNNPAGTLTEQSCQQHTIASAPELVGLAFMSPENMVF
jgi:hypothetical protein